MRLIAIILLLLFVKTTNAQDSLVQTLDSMEQHLEEVKDKGPGTVKLLNDMAWGYLYVNPARGLKLAQMAQDLANELKDSTGLAAAHSIIGTLSEISGRYGLAVENYQKALALYFKLKKWDSYAATLSNMGVLYDQAEYLDKAANYFREAIKVDKAYGGEAYLKSNYHNIAKIYIQQNEYDSALHYLKLAIANEREFGSEAEVPYFYGSLGALYAKLGKLDTAEVLLWQSLDYAKKKSDGFSIGYIYAYLADFYREVNKPDTAFRYLDLAHQKAAQSENMDLLLTVYDIKWNAQTQFNMYRQAVATGQTYMNLKDSVFNLQKSFQLSVLETEYQLDKKEQQVTALAVQNKAKSTYLLLISILSSAIILVTLVFFNINRRKNIKLQERNKTIEESLVNIQLLAKESHHRIKNNLQVISSLLKLQTKHVSNAEAKQSLTDAFHRIRAIALLHQRLYKADSVSKINLRSFLEQLSSQVLNSLGYDDDVTIEIGGDDVDLKLDQALYVGLIANELITNSIKYGFSEISHEARISMHIAKTHKSSLELTFHDNGVGFANIDSILEKDTFGFKILNSLLRTFDGELSLENDNGAKVIVKMNKIEHDE
ncbi:MAG: tetratricopeptide repeat protein [Bacteroidetes bacterium]|nr:tetratricopeptide repeat protein [Bacteroidota bacterium]